MFLIRSIALAVFGLVLVWTSPLFAQAQTVSVDSARILEYGVYASDVDSFILDNGVADHSKILSSNFRLLEPTDHIEAKLGTGFGLKYLIEGSPAGGEIEIEVVVEHPPLFNPKAGRTYLFSRTKFTRTLGRPAHTIWSFDEGWTLCPGAWVIRLEYQGRLLAKQAFSVSLKR